MGRVFHDQEIAPQCWGMYLINAGWHSPDSKVHEANMGPTWVLSVPDGPHVGPMNFAIRVDMPVGHIALLSLSCAYNWRPFGDDLITTCVALRNIPHYRWNYNIVQDAVISSINGCSFCEWPWATMVTNAHFITLCPTYDINMTSNA